MESIADARALTEQGTAQTLPPPDLVPTR